MLTRQPSLLPGRPAPNLPSKLVHNLISKAEVAHTKPWPIPLASDLVRLRTQGQRSPYENAMRSRQSRLTLMTLAGWLDENGPWLDEVVDGAWLFCEQDSWCWPIHDDAFQKRGWYLPDPEQPFLDLGASEVAVQLAWIVRLLGPRLREHCPGLVERIETEIDYRCFTPLLERTDWHWLGIASAPHNWCAWIHGNLLTAALALGNNTERLSEITRRCLEGLNRYVDSLPIDGGIDEGFSYWWNGAGRALEAFDYFSLATNNQVPTVPDLPPLRATVTFPWEMRLADDLYVSFSDAAARPHEALPWDTLWRASKAICHEESSQWSLQQFLAHSFDLPPELGLSRLVRTLIDEELFSSVASCVTKPAPYATSVWLPSLQFSLGRTKATEPTGFTFTLKGGHNDQNHNQNDVGTFTLNLNGEPLVVDPGRLEYTAQTFSDRRYEIWAMQSRWHSVPTISGLPQQTGRQFACNDATFSENNNTVVTSVSIADAYYPHPAPGTWRRTATLDRNRSQVTLQDSWSDLTGPHEVALILVGTVSLIDERTLSIGNSSQCLVRFSEPVRIEELRALDDPIMRNSWGDTLTRVTCRTSIQTSGTATITFEIAEKEKRQSHDKRA